MSDSTESIQLLTADPGVTVSLSDAVAAFNRWMGIGATTEYDSEAHDILLKLCALGLTVISNTLVNAGFIQAMNVLFGLLKAAYNVGVVAGTNARLAENTHEQLKASLN